MSAESLLDPLDPLAVDRELARAARAWRAWRRRLRHGAGLDEDPFEPHRAVAGRSAFLAVRGLPSAEPLATPLARWIHRLLEQRVNRGALALAEHARRVELHVVEAPEHTRATLAELLARALSDAPRRRPWVASFLERAGTLAEREGELVARRREIALRLGLASPDELELPNPELAEHAGRWLELTRNLGAELARPELTGFLELSLDPGDGAGWPSRLTPAVIIELFRGSPLLDRVALDPGRLPSALAPSSFLRALARVGAAWADALAPVNQPFVIAHDPYGLERYTTGAIFASLPLTRPFLHRQLRLGEAHARDAERTLARVLLLASRAAALRVTLRGPALAGRRSFAEAFEHGVEHTFGFALAPTLAGAVLRVGPDDGQRFAGWLLAASRSDALRDEHDEDYYRNPRAVERLRAEAALPPATTCTSAALEAGARALARRLEAAL
ncbi:MAG: hypothetical protein OZ921_11025 [Sorangiineae bacterium]|nr:hypothetical protein [Polyangiaceae bacterium]MEB2323039.1 hypothetical protein [Sorangiineae bacterium]